MTKLKNTTLLWKDGSILCGLQCYALASLVHFVTHTTKWTRGASALYWRPDRRPPSFRSKIWFFPTLPYCFHTLLQLHPNLKWKFTETFPLLCLRFFGWGGSKPTFKHNSFHLDITLQIKAFTASDELVSATHLQIWYHTADDYAYHQQRIDFVLETTTFDAWDSVLHWRLTL